MATLHFIGVLLGWVFDWRVLTLLAVVGVVVLYRVLGRTAATAAAVAGLGVILARWGWERGARSEHARQVALDNKAVATREGVQRSVGRAAPGEIRKRLARWATEE